MLIVVRDKDVIKFSSASSPSLFVIAFVDDAFYQYSRLLQPTEFLFIRAQPGQQL